MNRAYLRYRFGSGCGSRFIAAAPAKDHCEDDHQTSHGAYYLLAPPAALPPLPPAAPPPLPPAVPPPEPPAAPPPAPPAAAPPLAGAAPVPGWPAAAPPVLVLFVPVPVAVFVAAFFAPFAVLL